MVADVIFLDVVLIALLCVMVPALLRWRPYCVMRHTANQSSAKKRVERKPFIGLIHKPHCEACEEAAGAPPSRSPRAHRRR